MISALRWLKITPNQVTVTGTVLNLAAAVLVAMDHLIYAAIVFLIAGCFDMLDGALARLAQKVTPFGAFLDSTLDRVSEGVVFAAIAYSVGQRGAFGRCRPRGARASGQHPCKLHPGSGGELWAWSARWV